MELLYGIAACYVLALVGNVLIIRKNIAGVGGWLTMLADSRHGRLSNIAAIIILFFPPIIWYVLCEHLYYSRNEKRGGR